MRVGGVDVREYDLETLRNQVAMVLQKNVLFSGTIKENLRWGDKNASDEETGARPPPGQADEFIRAFPDGYDTYIEQGGTNVSGGQKQRLCIARALLKKPKILILDDSTSAVDTQTDALIRRAFAEEIPDTTKIHHRPARLLRAGRRQDPRAGRRRVVAIGTHDELLPNSEIYREVYDSQKKRADDEGGVPAHKSAVQEAPKQKGRKAHPHHGADVRHHPAALQASPPVRAASSSASPRPPCRATCS